MRLFLAITSILTWSTLATAQPLKVPPGFEVVEFAGEKLANDIQVMTVDPKGRVVVAGRGYIRILVDDNGDGKADRTLDFASAPKDGAMGLCWEGDTLYVMGDGGLRRFTSKTGVQADGPSELLRAMKTGGEHTAHAIRRGPDGWLYVLCGNTAGIDKSYAELPTSPIREPIAGCVLRFQPRTWKCEIVAHGFRNPYAFDFNLAGDLFTFDADNERCVSLPWYEPTRFYHVIEGRHYGWLNPQQAAFWRRPPYFCDVIAPVATLGRGSPTGAVCYDHNQFPPAYHGGFFLADWTFGKIHFVELQPKGASYTGKTSVFLEAKGDNGFAPTACAVDPLNGDLYISIGGRGTRGAVYRVRHRERFQAMKGKLAPLPRTARPLEWNVTTRKQYEKKLGSKSSADHLWALQMARRQKGFLGEDSVASPFAVKQYYDDLSVRLAQADLHADLLRMVSPGAANVLRQAILDNDEVKEAFVAGMGILHADRSVALNRGLFLARWSKFAERRLDGVRLIQLALGDVGRPGAIGSIWEGYRARIDVRDDATGRSLAKMFPSRDDDLDRELARTLGMLRHEDSSLRARLLARCDAESSPTDDIHYLACYAGLDGERDGKEARLVADLLLSLERKVAARKMNRDSNWQPRLRELYLGLVDKDEMLSSALLTHPEFGQPEHALFANTPGFPREKAARIFLDRWKRDKDYALNESIVQLLHVLPIDDVVPLVRGRWGHTGHEPSLLGLLGRKPIEEDRVRFVEGLISPQSSIVLASVNGLNKLGVKTNDAQTFALIRALQQTTDKQIELRNALIGRLQKTTGAAIGGDSKRWITWFASINPELGKRLANPDGVDVARWDARLAKLDWNSGQAEAGKYVFVKASCAQCHNGTQALGPGLAGVTKRFSRGDLFTAILQPSKDIASRYRMTIVETKDGKSYQGMVIYDAVDSLILQTAAATTVRLDGAAIVSRHVSGQSLMPAGALDALSDREISDLYAYLRTLK